MNNELNEKVLKFLETLPLRSDTPVPETEAYYLWLGKELAVLITPAEPTVYEKLLNIVTREIAFRDGETDLQHHARVRRLMTEIWDWAVVSFNPSYYTIDCDEAAEVALKLERRGEWKTRATVDRRQPTRSRSPGWRRKPLVVDREGVYTVIERRKGPRRAETAVAEEGYHSTNIKDE
jgi:hypothetical protein